MKLSFSFSKAAPMKKPVIIQPVEKEPDQRREVVGISQKAGIVIEKTQLDIDEEERGNLVIPCKTLYSNPEKERLDLRNVGHDGLKAMENQAGLISQPPGRASSTNTRGDLDMQDSTLPPPQKKRASSILMQIHAARKRGEIADAPNQEFRHIDPDEFGWALLRGMGYDEATDQSPDVTKTVTGNRTKLGIGVKLDSVVLPSDAKPK